MRGRKAFEGTVLDTVTKYIPLVIFKRALGCTIGWKDDTSSATLTLEVTDDSDAPVVTAGEAWQWGDTGETITGPVGATAGVTMISLENINHRRARLKIVAAADCEFRIWDYDGEEN